jgi:4-carboxymuconolactone decarboxylase
VTDAAQRDARFEHGMRVLEAVDGEAGDRLMDALGDISPDMVHEVAAWAYGDVYARPGLVPRDRQLVTLGMLTALGDTAAELKVHIGAALNVGLTPDEILEALLQSAVYCGFPRAINAVMVAKQVFIDRGILAVTPRG